jgi:membrane-anchored mycosin MYCP
MDDVASPLPDTAVQDELVVHLPHKDLVCGELGKMGIATDPKPDERLGLALVGLGTQDDLDTVLHRLRNSFREAYGGWVPLMGKNRHLDGVFGLPQPKTQSTDDLKMASAPQHIGEVRRMGHNVRVGVLDTKIFAHPDLVGRFVADEDDLFHEGSTPPYQTEGHATFVASLVLAPARAATVDARAVLNFKGTATTWATVQRMITFADSGIDILNLSLGCVTKDGRPPLLISRAIELLSARMLIVAAAGNHAQIEGMEKAPTWPAALPDVVAVGARDLDDTIAPFSPQLPWVNCTAPGRGVLGAYLDTTVKTLAGNSKCFEGYATWSGTSFAAASVSGQIAARTKPGKVTAQEALQLTLDDPASGVEKYVHADAAADA